MSRFRKISMEDYYRRNAQSYFYKTVSLDSTGFLRPFIDRLRPGSAILDVGCGSGRDLLLLKQMGHAVTGFDRSPELAALAREHAGCPVIEGDLERYDFSALSMDAILMSGVLVHVPPERLASVLARIALALPCRKRSGRNNSDLSSALIYLSLKEGRQQRQDPDGRVFYLWQDAELRHLFTELDFCVIDFLRSPSADGKGKSWLGYVLEAH